VPSANEVAMSGEKSKRQQELVSGLRDLGQEMMQAENRQAALTVAAAAAVTLTEAARAIVIVVDQSSRTVQVAAVSGLSREKAQRLLGGPKGDLIRQVIATGQAADSQQEHPSSSPETTSAEFTETGAYFCLPLQTAREPIGALFVERMAESWPFQGRDRLVLEVIAQRAAEAVQRWMLEEEIGRTLEAKSQFVSLVTHQLRVPLTSVVGYTDLLLSGMVGPNNEKQQEFLGTIKRNLQRMNVLIQDLSDINRLDAGRAELDIGPFSIGEAVRVVAARMRDSVIDRSQQLTLHIEPELPSVMADKNRFCQVLEQLITNASQYTPEGGRIGVSATTRQPFVAITIDDTGMGISENDQTHIFEEFYRSEDELVRQHVGWGLGLSLAKRLVEAQGGQLHFTSRPGLGSQFTFTVPATDSESGSGVRVAQSEPGG
jgi:signal transduction histidine kinase